MPPSSDDASLERRRLQRSSAVTRESLERSLSSWQRLLTAWGGVSNIAESVGNWERLALAESKLAQCAAEIERLQTALRG